MSRILIADDDINIAALLSDSLMDEGFETVVVHDGLQALDEINKGTGFELILLDIMMPNMEGTEVIKKVRDKLQCPILFITAKSRTLDTVVGLELGADDYITKPFVVEELVAKVKAHIRRDKRKAGSQEMNIHLGELRINRESYEVYKEDRRIELTTREFQLLMYLYDNIGKVLTREQIFDSIWGKDYFDVGTVTVTIKALRDKLDQQNKYIKTVWGVGYKLVK